MANHVIKSKMRHRKRLYDIAKQSGRSEDWAAYRSMRNQVNNDLQCAHSAYCSRLFEDSFSGNRRQFWKYIHSRRKDSSGISTLLDNGEYISDPKGKASTLSNQFQSVFTIEDHNSVPSLHSIHHISAMPAISISTKGICNLLCNLDASKAMGPDRISPYILKYCAAEISPILQLIFTQSLDTGQLPSDWLRANICPVFKRGNRSTPSNYRPISLTSSCCKVFEHIIFHSIMDHVRLNNILIDNQHAYGFRPGFSCQTQLISLIEDISHALDNQLQTDLIMLDFSKAFDTVAHKCLMAKLHHYRVDHQVCAWIQSWLTQRTQTVVVDGISSPPVHVLSGVPQGTVLGPLMFLLYINDIATGISSPLRLFADDCLLYRTINSVEDSFILQTDLELLSQWATVWQMKFNVSKCIVIRCTRSHTPVQYGYRLNNITLSTDNQHTYLGILLHKSLSWSGHIASIASKASQIFNFLRRNLSKCSSTVKASSYLALVRPIMEYAASVWDPYHHNDILALEKVQRRAARWVMNDYSRYSSVSSMLNDLNWPSLHFRRRINRLQTFYKAIYNSSAFLIILLFKDLPDISTHSTLSFHPQELLHINNLIFQEQLKIGMSFLV